MRNAVHVAVQTLAPWSLGIAMAVSITASAGESTRPFDRGFRRSTMIEAHRMTLMLPRFSAFSRHREAPYPPESNTSSSGATRMLAHIRKVDLAREASGNGDIGRPVLFLSDHVVLPAQRLEPALTMERAARALLHRLNRFDGRTIAPGMRGGRTGNAEAQGVSPQILTRNRPDGATPAALRATALASVTPAPIEPEIVAAASMRVPAFARVHTDPSGKPVETARLRLGAGYLDLIQAESLAQESQCLAEAVYFEARSEPAAGQAAVAQVVLNRVRSGLYPTSVCGVVYQNRHRYKACQFTFACEGRSLAIREPGAWATAQRIAREVLEGASYNIDVGTSTHYHANYVSPYWSRKLKRTEQIGRHIFYRLRPGQT